ncbi:hypothetical protein FACS189472_16770 [Alphaproteobacteria bacterium]|nr:hypothetical protein FACS189472_16770 [Alphaproteobacteria bacterium]
MSTKLFNKLTHDQTEKLGKALERNRPITYVPHTTVFEKYRKDYRERTKPKSKAMNIERNWKIVPPTRVGTWN